VDSGYIRAVFSIAALLHMARRITGKPDVVSFRWSSSKIQAGSKGALSAVPQTIGRTAEDIVTFKDRRAWRSINGC
jgi:hypothetical protein